MPGIVRKQHARLPRHPDFLSTIASLFFEKRLGDGLAVVQSSILMALGLQRKSIEEIEVSGLVWFHFVSFYCVFK